MNLVFKLIFGKSGIYIIGSILNGNPGCYTYEHITVAMLIPGMGLTSASITPAEIRVFQGRICYIKDKSRFKAESSSISGSRAVTEPKSLSSH
jgi:hypothetical protein